MESQKSETISNPFLPPGFKKNYRFEAETKENENGRESWNQFQTRQK